MYSQSQKFLLCKKMNIKNCKGDCQRAHNIHELEKINCINGLDCKNVKCPYIHPNEFNMTKEE